MNRYKLLMFLWITTFSLAHTQTVDDCKKALRQAFVDMSIIGEEVPNGKTYFLDYTVESELRNAENEAGPQRIKALFTADRAMVLNDYVEMYVDKKQTFSVLPNEKRVIWSDAYLGMNQQLQLDYNKKFLDSLLVYADVTICAEQEKGDELYWEVELNCSVAGQKMLNYSKVTILLNRTRNLLANIDISFTSNSAVEHLNIAFHTIDYNYSGPLIALDFAAKYIRSEALITDHFDEFELVDVRR